MEKHLLLSFFQQEDVDLAEGDHVEEVVEPEAEVIHFRRRQKNTETMLSRINYEPHTSKLPQPVIFLAHFSSSILLTLKTALESRVGCPNTSFSEGTACTAKMSYT